MCPLLLASAGQGRSGPTGAPLTPSAYFFWFVWVASPRAGSGRRSACSGTRPQFPAGHVHGAGSTIAHTLMARCAGHPLPALMYASSDGCCIFLHPSFIPPHILVRIFLYPFIYPICKTPPSRPVCPSLFPVEPGRTSPPPPPP